MAYKITVGTKTVAEGVARKEGEALLHAVALAVEETATRLGHDAEVVAKGTGNYTVKYYVRGATEYTKELSVSLYEDR